MKQAEAQKSVDFVLNIIPDSVVGALARGDILQVLLFAILFGFALISRLIRHSPPPIQNLRTPRSRLLVVIVIVTMLYNVSLFASCTIRNQPQAGSKLAVCV